MKLITAWIVEVAQAFFSRILSQVHLLASSTNSFPYSIRLFPAQIFVLRYPKVACGSGKTPHLTTFCLFTFLISICTPAVQSIWLQGMDYKSIALLWGTG